MAMKKTLNFKNLLSEYSEYSDFCAALKKGKTPISVAGVVESAVPQFIFGAPDSKNTLVITYSDQEAKQLLFDLELYTENVRFFPTKEYVFYEIDAHDRALPLMFDFKNKYFKYELWNALRLKSPNQVRMYEILKQWIILIRIYQYH